MNGGHRKQAGRWGGGNVLGECEDGAPKDGTTWRRLFPWEGEACRNLGRGKAEVQEMLGQVGCDITRVPKGHCPRSTRSQ